MWFEPQFPRRTKPVGVNDVAPLVIDRRPIEMVGKMEPFDPAHRTQHVGSHDELLSVTMVNSTQRGAVVEMVTAVCEQTSIDDVVGVDGQTHTTRHTAASIETGEHTATETNSNLSHLEPNLAQTSQPHEQQLPGTGTFPPPVDQQQAGSLRIGEPGIGGGRVTQHPPRLTNNRARLDTQQRSNLDTIQRRTTRTLSIRSRNPSRTVTEPVRGPNDPVPNPTMTRRRICTRQRHQIVEQHTKVGHHPADRRIRPHRIIEIGDPCRRPDQLGHLTGETIVEPETPQHRPGDQRPDTLMVTERHLAVNNATRRRFPDIVAQRRNTNTKPNRALGSNKKRMRQVVLVQRRPRTRHTSLLLQRRHLRGNQLEKPCGIQHTQRHIAALNPQHRLQHIGRHTTRHVAGTQHVDVGDRHSRHSVGVRANPNLMAVQRR